MNRGEFIQYDEPSYEERRLRILEQLEDAEPGTDFTLSTDREADHEPAGGRLLRLPRIAAPPHSGGGQVPTAPAARLGSLSRGPRDPYDQHDLPPAA